MPRAYAIGVWLAVVAGCACSDHVRVEEDVGSDATEDAAPLGPVCEPGCGAATDVCVTQFVACAVRASDQVAVCWGLDIDGQLGDGISLTTPSSHVACPRGDCSPTVEVLDESGAPLHALHVACADRAICAVRVDGRVACWGSNADGQLGRSTSTPMLARAGIVPDLPSTDLATDVQAGWSRFCATTASGQTWCWGRDGAGAFGDGHAGAAAPFHASLWPVGATPYLGADHSCAIRLDGTVVCVGDDAYGELGPNGGGTTQRSPVVVPLPGPATDMVADYYATCAIVDGVPWCWGAGEYGQLGRVPPPTTACACDDTPVAVSGVSGLARFWPAAASPQVCGETTGGDVVCWGTLTDYCALPGGSCDSPSPIPALRGASVISSSQYTTCATFAEDGRVECFGANANRQLGYQGPARSVPVRACLCEAP